MCAKPLSNEPDCWGRRCWCCKCSGGENRGAAAVHVSTPKFPSVLAVVMAIKPQSDMTIVNKPRPDAAGQPH